MYTTVAFAESLDPAAAWVNFAACLDDHVTVNGDDILVPVLNKLIGYGVVCDLTVQSQARFRSPSLLERGFEEYVEPVGSGLTWGTIAEMIMKTENPIELKTLEALQLQILSNPGAAAVHYGVCLLGDGPITPVKGNIMTVRTTASITLSAVAWVNGALTFPVSLAAGKYQLVGARCMSTNGVAFRFRFQGMPWRPGGPCANVQTDYAVDPFRNGRMGVWGEFTHVNPPTIDVLGVTDTAQVVYLDLIKVA